MKKYLFFIFILTLLINPVLSYAQGADSENKAPGFILTDINDNQVSFSEFEGQVVILDFWATWCPYCVKGMPALNNIYLKYKDKGLAVFGINFKESAQKVKSFIEKKGYSYMVLLDADGQVTEKYEVRGFPTYIIVDKGGNVVFYGHGLPDKMDKVLDTLLSE